MSGFFQNQNLLEEKWKLNYIYLIIITKADIQSVYTSKFSKKIDLASLKSNVYKLDITQFKK